MINFSLSKKIKTILKVFGLKTPIYKIFYFFLQIFLKSKNTFINSIIFDIYSKKSKYILTENSYKEKFILISQDKVISKEIFVKGEFDLKKLEKTLEFLRPTHKIKKLYDIGANLGVTCIPAVQRKMIQTAIAVEPVMQNYDILKMNIILNKLEEKIMHYNYALSDRANNDAKIEISKNNSGDNKVILESNLDILNQNNNIQKIVTDKFDNLFKNINGNEDLIWIDTQGYEPKVLMGAENLLKSKAPIVIEFWPYELKRNGLWAPMFEILEKFDFFVDLSEKTLEKKKINSHSLNDLSSNWEKDKYKDSSLFTDFLLLKK